MRIMLVPEMPYGDVYVERSADSEPTVWLDENVYSEEQAILLAQRLDGPPETR